MPIPETEEITERRESFGFQLRSRLDAKSMSARSMAAAADVHHRIVLEILNGQRGIELARIQDYGPEMVDAARAYLDAVRVSSRPAVCVAKLATARRLQARKAAMISLLLEALEDDEVDIDELVRLERELQESIDMEQDALDDVRAKLRARRNEKREIATIAKCQTGAVAQAKAVR